mmetsp:Transcript_4690/g.11810  ORF Transcript_4690/g.11810 Transcript_4690/m.11810 type:complete len:276 (-) Transcript_4690:1588-2415(-)
MICPPPRWMGSGAIDASKILNLTLRIGSSHSGPSRHDHWKPCKMKSRIELRRTLSTSEGSVSSTRTFAPRSSGAKPQTERAASRSQSYLFWKKSPSLLRSQWIETLPASMSSARPFSRGSAIIVSLERWFGVSAKHLSDEVSTTVSQKVTTGSDTLTSISAYTWRRSCITQSMYSSPVPMITCSPDSSTLVLSSGYALFSLRRPSSIFGSSEGLRGSAAIFITEIVSKASGRKMHTSSELALAVRVPDLVREPSTPSMSAQQPAGTSVTSTRYRD